MSSSSPESDVTSMDFRDTELTLGLPGKGRSRSPAVTGGKSCMKRGYIKTVDFSFSNSSSSDLSIKTQEDSGAGKPPAAKAQVVGWPPVKSSRKKALENCKYVKVGADGAPFLRKVDLETYESYEALLKALEEMFDCITMSRNFLYESKLMDPAKGLMDYVPTYEDKDGDWMLVGDVPWKMFTESCKRIQLVKSSEAAVLAPRTHPKCTN